METFTIAEAAAATGLTKKAMRNRVDRGQLRAVLRDGVRRIPRSELDRLGLLGAGSEAAERQVPHEAASAEAVRSEVIRELLDRVERQSAEITTLRALTAEAESLKNEREVLEAQLFEARARVLELEARAGRRWFRAFRAAAA